jgi:hypothetical protein
MSEAKPNQNKNYKPLLNIIFLLLLLLMSLVVVYQLYNFLRKASDRQATQTLVGTIATAMQTYQTKTWTWETTKPGDPITLYKTYHLWDLNMDGFIDGRPALTSSSTTDGGFSPELLKNHYEGFLVMASPIIQKKFILNNLQPIDAWGNLLRIEFDKVKYSNTNFCVWSIGPDGINGTTDDILSALPKPTQPVGPAASP